MSHMPINHPLRPVYRALTMVTGALVLVFGVLGFIAAADEPFFDRGDTIVLGLQTNLAFACASVVAGAMVLLTAFIGRNVDYIFNLWAGPLFMVAGLAGLALLKTDLNAFNFSVSTVIVSFLIGMVLFAAGLYGRTGSPAAAKAEEALRHGAH